MTDLPAGAPTAGRGGRTSDHAAATNGHNEHILHDELLRTIPRPAATWPQVPWDQYFSLRPATGSTARADLSDPLEQAARRRRIGRSFRPESRSLVKPGAVSDVARAVHQEVGRNDLGGRFLNRGSPEGLTDAPSVVPAVLSTSDIRSLRQVHPDHRRRQQRQVSAALDESAGASPGRASRPAGT